jgi:serine/threonine protein kinase/formylglycine-generating enzyme required for sulfatase activity
MTDDIKHDGDKPDGDTTNVGGAAGPAGDNDKPKVARKSLGKDPTMPIRLDRKLWRQMKEQPPGSGAPPPPPMDEPDVVLDDNLEVVWPATGEAAPAPVGETPVYSRTAKTPPPADRVPTPAPTPAAPAPAPADDGDNWVGSEKTMIGGAVPAAAPTPAPAELPREEGWKGDEHTLIGGAPANPVAEAEAQAWTGNEATAVGIPVPKMTPPGATPGPGGGEEWAGREATLLGMTPAGGGSLSIESASDVAERKKREGTGSGTRQGSGTRGGTSGTSGGPNQKSGSRTTNPTLDDAWHLKGRQGALTGKTLGDYEVGGILGEGGMGTVYRARQISLKRRVALKVLPSNLAQDLRLRERFEIEARTASLLNSPHVVAVFAAGTQDDIVYFVMEYVEGTDLSAIISEKKDRGEKMTAEEAAGYILQAARGLAEAGKHNIVHRDIKPPNLMVTSKGVVKIADFGISKVAGEHGLTMTGTAVGTPAYCSPEQGRGDQVDSRADIYSLGVVFYELLTGQKPFDGTSANALIYQHNYAEPPLPTSIDPGISEQYQAVVMKCLQKDPAKRYQDAAELVQDLERIRDGNMSLTAVFSAKFGTGADEAMSRYLGVKKTRTWPYIVGAVAAVVLLGGGYLYIQSTNAEQESVKTLRKTLVDELDSPVALKGDVTTNLARYTAIKGKGDADVVRWNKKLDQVKTLKGDQHLARLDLTTSPLVAADLFHDAVKDLDNLKVLIGPTDVDEARWQAKLDGSGAQLAAIRGQLKELDTASPLTIALVERLHPPLDKLRLLVGDKDADFQRWKQEGDGLIKSVADERKDLGNLDGQDLPTEAALTADSNELTTLRQAVGDNDADVLKWDDAIKRDRDVIAQLRTHVAAKLDNVEVLSFAVRTEVKPDLVKLQKLADANDPQVARWTAQLDAAEKDDKDLRGRLARLDDPKPLKQSEQDALSLDLGRLSRVVSNDDAEVARWTKRLANEKNAIAGMGATLKRLDDPATMTVAEQDAAAKAVAGLHDLGYLDDDTQLKDDHRIEDDRAIVKDMRDRLQKRADNHEAISSSLVADVEKFAKLASEDDPDVKQWRVRLRDYNRLHDALADLDKPTALPRDVDANLVAFEGVVGPEDDQLIRWKDKVAKVKLMRSSGHLAALDKVQPILPSAAADLDLLKQLVGTDEDDVQRWSKKLDRVNVLVANLSDQLGTVDKPEAAKYVLPEDASAPSDAVELARENIGTSEPRMKWWIARVALLEGPPSPGWASDYGRDQYGPWADLTVSGIKQRFRYIPPGKFWMGSDEKEKGRDPDELHVEVTLTRAFWLAETDCTQGLWRAVVTAAPDAGLNPNPSRFISDERPVERVSWDDSHAFLVALSKMKESGGMVARLPSEAEWEYACRGGSDAPRSSYQGEVPEAKLDTIAWFRGDAQGSTKGVGRRLPNRLGLLDMLGNVWQWTDDNYGTYSPNAIDPHGRQEETRVARGGSWGDSADHLRAANRLALRQDMRTVYVGFRIAADVAWPGGKVPAPNLANDLLPNLLEDTQNSGAFAPSPVTAPDAGMPATAAAAAPTAAPAATDATPAAPAPLGK